MKTRAPSHSTEPVIEQSNATGRVSYWQRGDNHSVADRHGVSLAEYIHAMFGLLRQAKSRDVLMIGCGGGTLATMLHRAGANVTMVDIDAHSIEIARRYFHVPPEVECHVADGRAFLRRAARRYDAIVLDAYTGSSVPRQFLKSSFFDLVKTRLRPPDGIFLMNVIIADDRDPVADDLMRLLHKTWRSVRLLDADGWLDRNAVIAAGAVGTLTRPRLLMRPQRSARRLATLLRELDFRGVRA